MNQLLERFEAYWYDEADILSFDGKCVLCDVEVNSSGQRQCSCQPNSLEITIEI